MACKIGAITIGQSPRTDVVPEMLPLLGGIELDQRGALDGLSREEIAAIAPGPADYVLVTRLNDGSSVRIAEKHILQRMQALIDELTIQGAAGILLLCTGEFPAFRSTIPVLYPQKLLRHFIAGTVSDQTVGVLTPDASQVPQATRRWREYGVPNVVVEPASPYGDAAAVVAAGLRLQERQAQVIVMDCIGYTVAMKAAIADRTGLPVIVPRTVAARAAAELFG
ncbi:MAG: AroM family protein [Sporomusaceae bacterium]|nr:AroM family protein [Sporomusaceae bacterium]